MNRAPLERLPGYVHMRKSISLARVGLIAGVSVAVAGCGRSGGAPPVAAAAAPTVGVVAVAREPLSRSLKLSAAFKPYQDIAVNAKVAGYVKTIYVDVGDKVKAGELIAQLEIPELQDQINQENAAVAQSQENITRDQDLLAQAQANYQASHLAYTRLDEVMKTQPGLVAQQEVDDAQGKDQGARAQVDAAKAALAGAQSELAAAQAGRQRVQTMYAYSRITAPFAGVITQRFADTGAMIQAGTTQAMPVVRLAQNDLLRLGIPVPETVVPQIHIGMPATVQVPALGRDFDGKVARFADQITLDTRTMYTEIDVPNPSGVLVPGMYAFVTLDLADRADALAVPVQALNRGTGQTTVLVVNARHQVETRTVTLGLETPSAVEVTSGLQPGDLVVVSGGSLLQPGETVTPKTVTLPTITPAS